MVRLRVNAAKGCCFVGMGVVVAAVSVGECVTVDDALWEFAVERPCRIQAGDGVGCRTRDCDSVGCRSAGGWLDQSWVLTLNCLPTCDIFVFSPFVARSVEKSGPGCCRQGKRAVSCGLWFLGTREMVLWCNRESHFINKKQKHTWKDEWLGRYLLLYSFIYVLSHLIALPFFHWKCWLF